MTRVLIDKSDAPLGRRGEHPITFQVPPGFPRETLKQVAGVPGVIWARGGVACTWDVAPFVAHWLGATSPVVPVEENLAADELFAETEKLIDGRQGLLDHLARLRKYQVEGSLFLARRRIGMNTDSMRLGKSVQTETAWQMVGGKALAIVPAIAKLVWASEAVKWFNLPSVILQGRSGSEAFVFCPSCFRKETEQNPSLCQRERLSLPKRKKKLEYIHPVQPERVDEILSEISLVIVNYDILVAQHATDARGALYLRRDLEGWCRRLSAHKFRVAWGDEFHLCRGWTKRDVDNRAQSRSERVAEVTSGIPYFWGITGTPLMSYPRDYARQVDLLSAGAMTCAGSKNYRKSFPFTVRYCDAHHGEYGWVDHGETPLYREEFLPRLNTIRIGRARAQVLKEMPAKDRQVYRLEAPKDFKAPRRASSAQQLAALIRKTGQVKIGLVTDQLISEALEGDGAKLIVYTFHKPTLAELTKKLQAAAQSGEYKQRATRLGLKIWSASGDVAPLNRSAMAKAFVDHQGAGIFCATIDAVQVAISLVGAQSVHFIDFHWNPPAMLQAEDRPFEPGSLGLVVCYYVLMNSIDEYVEAHVLPKVRHLAEASSADEAQKMLAAFDDKAAAAEILRASAAASIDDDAALLDDFEFMTETDSFD